MYEYMFCNTIVIIWISFLLMNNVKYIFLFRVVVKEKKVSKYFVQGGSNGSLEDDLSSLEGVKEGLYYICIRPI